MVVSFDSYSSLFVYWLYIYFFFKNKRVATSMIVGLRYQDPVSQNSVVSSRTVAVVQYNQHKFAADAFTMLQQFNLSPLHQASWLVGNQTNCNSLQIKSYIPLSISFWSVLISS